MWKIVLASVLIGVAVGGLISNEVRRYSAAQEAERSAPGSPFFYGDEHFSQVPMDRRCARVVCALADGEPARCLEACWRSGESEILAVHTASKDAPLGFGDGEQCVKVACIKSDKRAEDKCASFCYGTSDKLLWPPIH